MYFPHAQRRYLWGEEQVRQLLEHIREAKHAVHPDPVYDIGTIVLIGKWDKNELGQAFQADVVDGQQRTTTLVLIYSVLLHSLAELGSFEMGYIKVLFGATKNEPQARNNVINLQNKSATEADSSMVDFLMAISAAIDAMESLRSGRGGEENKETWNRQVAEANQYFPETQSRLEKDVVAENASHVKEWVQLYLRNCTSTLKTDKKALLKGLLTYLNKSTMVRYI